MKTTVVKTHEACTKMLKPVRDALEVLQGKWKLPILISLTFGDKRFTDIAKEVEGITDRMLSKELRDLELNDLVKRTVETGYPVKITYSLTPHSKSLDDVIDALRNWGVMHKKKLAADCKKRRK